MWKYNKMWHSELERQKIESRFLTNKVVDIMEKICYKKVNMSTDYYILKKAWHKKPEDLGVKPLCVTRKENMFGKVRKCST